MKNVLVIVAHPDDEVLGCGGIFSKYIKMGVTFRVIFLGEGSSCRFQSLEGDEIKEAIELRNLCAAKAMTHFGIDQYAFYNLPCGRFDQVPILDINKIIEKEINIFSPDTVYTHSGHDANNDHKIVFNSTIMATRPRVSGGVQRVYSFEVLTSSEWNFLDAFLPNTFDSLTEDDVKKKWAALALYDSEINQYPFPRSREGVQTLAMMRGMQSGFEFAEAFHLVRELR